jgi:lysophosphatidate acyltransferase
MSSIILLYAFRVVGGYVIGMTILASTLAAYQESKIWKTPKKNTTNSNHVTTTTKTTATTSEQENEQLHVVIPLSFIGYCKAFLFNATWMIGCFIGSTIILLKYWISFGHVDLAYECHQYVEHPLSLMLMRCFIGTVQVNGMENLPPDDQASPAPVYIANHASQLDISSVYFMKRRFKWIAKLSVLYVPGVGQLMYLAQHVLIKRTGKNKESIHQLYEMSNDAVQHGIPMFLFPQGTRVIQKQLPFKNGAFIIAQTNHSVIVPITIQIPISPPSSSSSSSSGSSESNPKNTPIIYQNPWNTLYPFSYWIGLETKPIIHITIHKPIQVTGQEDMNALKEQCMNTIYSVLPPFHHNGDACLPKPTTTMNASKKTE